MDSHDKTCTVCRERIDIFAIGNCDHPVCYKCATRMRLLCKLNYCAICRAELKQVVLIRSLLPYKDIDMKRLLENSKHGILYQDEGVRRKFYKLLEHACPFCPSRAPDRQFEDLSRHVRRVHELFYCDLCVQHLNIFTSERKCYTRPLLATHRRNGDSDDSSYKGHPLCEFCSERYLDNDELGRHLFKDHFHCHFCDNNHFYSGYGELRDHFLDEHFLCEEGDCYTQHFTNAFPSDVELRLHRASCHSKSLTKAQVRQGLVLDVEFQLPPRTLYAGDDRDGSGRGRGRGRGRGTVQKRSANGQRESGESIPNADDINQFPTLNNQRTAQSVTVARDNSLAHRLALSAGNSVGSLTFDSSPHKQGDTRPKPSSPTTNASPTKPAAKVPERFTVIDDDEDHRPREESARQPSSKSGGTNVCDHTTDHVAMEKPEPDKRHVDRTQALWVNSRLMPMSSQHFPSLPVSQKPPKQNSATNSGSTWQATQRKGRRDDELPNKQATAVPSKPPPISHQGEYPSLPGSKKPQSQNKVGHLGNEVKKNIDGCMASNKKGGQRGAENIQTVSKKSCAVQEQSKSSKSLSNKSMHNGQTISNGQDSKTNKTHSASSAISQSPKQKLKSCKLMQDNRAKISSNSTDKSESKVNDNDNKLASSRPAQTKTREVNLSSHMINGDANKETVYKNSSSLSGLAHLTEDDTPVVSVPCPPSLKNTEDFPGLPVSSAPPRQTAMSEHDLSDSNKSLYDKLVGMFQSHVEPLEETGALSSYATPSFTSLNDKNDFPVLSGDIEISSNNSLWLKKSKAGDAMDNTQPPTDSGINSFTSKNSYSFLRDQAGDHKESRKAKKTDDREAVGKGKQDKV